MRPASVCRVAYPRIFLFGDSLTQRSFSEEGCWGSLVAEAFERRCDVVVRGFSGYNTRMCKYVLPRIFGPEDAENLAAFVMFLGANDCAEPTDCGKQHIPLKEYVSNMEGMLEYLKGCGVPENKLILLTPPPYCDEMWVSCCRETGRSLPRRSLESVARYVGALSKLGEENNIAVLNLFASFQQESNWQKLLLDGLHLSKSGSQKLAKLLVPFLNRVIGPVPEMFPNWKTMDPVHPESDIASWVPNT
uniref:Putative isoamyl acetate-hydrolyzing esterase n=1 Tax=Amblyomma sculptum TaxID=1581419 RepID=A0A1E1XRD1_AMBSC